MQSVVQQQILFIAVGKTLSRLKRRLLRTPLSRLPGSGTSTLVGTRALSADRIMLAPSAHLTTSFIVATITGITWSATQIIVTVAGGVSFFFWSKGSRISCF